MVVRLVKMTLRPGEVKNFQALFGEWRHEILDSPGCLRLELLHDKHDPRIFFTHSYWATEEDLEQYRRSEVFARVWPVTKALFAERAEAWSLHLEHSMNVGRTGQPSPRP